MTAPITVMSIIQSMSRIYYENEQGLTSLMIAAAQNDLQSISVLIGLNVDCNYQNKKQETALMYAVKHNQYDAAKLLLNNGADPAIKDFVGLSAITYAVGNSNMQILKLLLQTQLFKAPAAEYYPCANGGTSSSDNLAFDSILHTHIAKPTKIKPKICIT